MIVLTGLIVVCACWLRYLPQLIAGSLGVDHWFWKLYVTTCRSQRRFPPRLPQYLLDQQQWYPPVFPLCLAACPWGLSEQGSRLLPIAIDASRLLLMLATVGWLTGGNRLAMLQAGVVYTTTPILVSYNVQLNPRGFGALLLDVLGVLLLRLLVGDHPVNTWILVAVAVLIGLIPLTHKMTTQLLWFLAIGGALVTRRWALVSVIPISMICATVLSGGFYRRVLRAHADIVAFWHRNWRWLQADPVRESPLYGIPGFQTPGRFYERGIPGVRKHLAYLVGFNPWAWLVPFLLIVPSSDARGESLVATWTVLTLAFAVLTVAVPWLRSLGSGYFYLYNAAFPIAILFGMRTGTSRAGMAVWGAGILLCAGALTKFYRQLRRRPDLLSSDFSAVISFLKGASPGTVWCLPFNPSDLIAYHTGHDVLYGGHGFGFRELERVFPRIVTPIRTICADYRVRYVVAAEDYLPGSVLAEFAIADVQRFGSYSVYVVESFDRIPRDATATGLGTATA